MKLFGSRQPLDIEALRRTGSSRQIRIHSQSPQPDGTRVAFEFLDPPGPYSMQFYEAAPDQQAVLARLPSGTEARYYESRDRARTRVIETLEGEILVPRAS